MMIRRITNPHTHCGWISQTTERSFGRICNPTALSISICNAIKENNDEIKRIKIQPTIENKDDEIRRITNPYTHCDEIRRITNPYTHCGWIANPAEQNNKSRTKEQKRT
ncbi:MAG: hypothetical protein J5552_03940 [Prevotella sp.]|nr:hypothetical protein [Prevotella sp.]